MSFATYLIRRRSGPSSSNARKGSINVESTGQIQHKSRLQLSYTERAGVIVDTAENQGCRQFSIRDVGTTKWLSLEGELSPSHLAMLGAAVLSVEIDSNPTARVTTALRVVSRQGENVDSGYRSVTLAGRKSHKFLYEASELQRQALEDGNASAKVILFLPLAPQEFRIWSTWCIPANQ